MKVWIVYRVWPGGKQDIIAGFFDEDNARFEAGKLVGRDKDVLVGLFTVDVSEPVNPES